VTAASSVYRRAPYRFRYATTTSVRVFPSAAGPLAAPPPSSSERDAAREVVRCVGVLHGRIRPSTPCPCGRPAGRRTGSFARVTCPWMRRLGEGEAARRGDDGGVGAARVGGARAGDAHGGLPVRGGRLGDRHGVALAAGGLGGVRLRHAETIAPCRVHVSRHGEHYDAGRPSRGGAAKRLPAATPFRVFRNDKRPPAPDRELRCSCRRISIRSGRRIFVAAFRYQLDRRDHREDLAAIAQDDVFVALDCGWPACRCCFAVPGCP
jgi:hypothetical protein